MPDADFVVETEHEVGLLLPDGREIFPPETFHDHDIGTPEGRELLVGALKNSADQLGMPADELLGRYHWLVRINYRYISHVPGDAEQYPLNNFPVVPVSLGEQTSDLEPEASE